MTFILNIFLCTSSSMEGKPWIAISADDMGAAFVVVPDDATDPDNWLYTKSLIVDDGANEIIGKFILMLSVSLQQGVAENFTLLVINICTV